MHFGPWIIGWVFWSLWWFSARARLPLVQTSHLSSIWKKNDKKRISRELVSIFVRNFGLNDLIVRFNCSDLFNKARVRCDKLLRAIFISIIFLCLFRMSLITTECVISIISIIQHFNNKNDLLWQCNQKYSPCSSKNEHPENFAYSIINSYCKELVYKIQTIFFQW